MKIPAAAIHFPKEDVDLILEEAEAILNSGALTLGKWGRGFEDEFAQYVGMPYAVATNSGTSSLELPLRVFKYQDDPDMEVICPNNTFFATASAIIRAGFKLRICDVDKRNLCASLRDIKNAVTPNTVGVVLVHIGGIVAPDVKEIKQFCEDNQLFLIEDAAHAHGASFDGVLAGSFGDASSFSFFPTKVMTSGEGGMALFKSEAHRNEALIYRDQGKAGGAINFHTRLGYNWRMSELHAVVGLTQLRRLNEFIAARTKIAKQYDQMLTDKPISGLYPLRVPWGVTSNYYKYVVNIDSSVNRAELKAKLKELGVSLSGEVYEFPLSEQPIFKSYIQKDQWFPGSKYGCDNHICLPISAKMTEDMATYVVESLTKALS